MLRILLALTGLLFISPSFAGSSDPYEMSESDIELVQTKLYELNYGITAFDGKLGPETRRAITEYQEAKNHAATGIITEAEFKALQDADTSGLAWAALSSSTDGAYSSFWNQGSRTEAKRKALSGCREKSNDPEKCTTVTEPSVNTSDQGWIAAVQCRRSDDEGEHTRISVSSRTKRALAVEGAFDYATKGGYLRNDCTLLTAIDARGRHK